MTLVLPVAQVQYIGFTSTFAHFFWPTLLWCSASCTHMFTPVTCTFVIFLPQITFLAHKSFPATTMHCLHLSCTPTTITPSEHLCIQTACINYPVLAPSDICMCHHCTSTDYLLSHQVMLSACATHLASIRYHMCTCTPTNSMLVGIKRSHNQ